MNNITKKIIAVFSVVSISMTSLVGCGDKKNNESSADDAMTQYALEIGSAEDNNPIAADPGVDLESEDPTAASGTDGSSEAVEEATEVEEVTDAAGQPVTEFVAVTDEAGEPVTDAEGQTVTEAVKVTTIVKSSSGSSNTQTSTSAASSYEANFDGRYAMWLDVSKDENFYFEGDFLKATFKVKDNIPDGDYKFRISPDLSDVAGVAVSPSKVLDGTIRVNNGSIEPIDVSGETGMVFYGDNVACKQGDTIEWKINIKNNTGLVAFVIWFYFDSNAFEFVGAEASGEFEDIAKNTEIGSGKKTNS